MKALLSSLLVLVALGAIGQSQWPSLFRTDPELSNGYFIVDQDKVDALGIVRVEVDIIAAEVQADGSVNSSVVEILVITDGFFAQADFDLWDGLQDPYRVHYHAQGFDSADKPVVDVQSVPTNHQPWPELCRETCESNLYAYSLVSYSNDVQSVIEIQNAYVNGNSPRLYVKASDWQAFQNMFDPWEHFGFGGGEWTEILSASLNPDQTDVIRLEYPNETPPPGARDYMGYLLGPVAQDVYAVSKGKGPWRDLHAHTAEIAGQVSCTGSPGQVRNLYNADLLVQSAMAQYNMDPLICMGMMVTGGVLTWGSGYSSHWCTTYTVEEGTSTDPPNVVLGVTYSIVACSHTTLRISAEGISEPGGSGPNGTYVLADVADIIVNHWTPGARTKVLSVPVNGIEDPKLWSVLKTEVTAGLYEFMLIMDDGRILTRFVEFNSPTTLNADFAAFTNIIVYPVPVREDLFAIDFDLLAPMNIDLTIVNNMGVQYYNAELVFELAGKNKHVVKMATQWPAGIYHAVFQYEDGSSESVSFNVQEP